MGDLQYTYVTVIPPCVFHWELRGIITPASYDAKTKYGPWGYLCTACFVDHGTGLGLGRGQLLFLREDGAR